MLTFRKKQAPPFCIIIMTASLLSSCFSINAEVGYDPEKAVEPISAEAAPVSIGQFTDRRGTNKDWIGEVRGRYYFPRSVLTTNRPVTEVVRNVVVDGANERGMLAELNDPPRYQIYGSIVRLEGLETAPSDAHAHLIIRLFDLAESRDVHVGNYRADVSINAGSVGGNILDDVIEDALNRVVSESLDDPELQAILLSNS